MPKRVALYCRVSTDGQTIENQLRELTAWAVDRLGHAVTHVYKDEGISGAKGRDKRPGFNELNKGIQRKQFDMVAAWAVDRLGRSLQDLVGFLNDMHSQGVDLYLHQQGINTSTPSGKMMFQMLGVFAEFERSMIQARVKSGLERAKAQGKVLGRPKLPPEITTAILEGRKQGKGIRLISREVGCSPGTVRNVIASI